MKKLLTAEQMREADRLAIESGIPGLILMESAASRVVDFLVERFSPLPKQRITVVCGKGNNGGDGFAIARQLLTRFAPEKLSVHLALGKPVGGDALVNYEMYLASGGTFATEIDAASTLVIDALLGTGFAGELRGDAKTWVDTINTAYPKATVVAVDVPSGLAVKAHHTVTFAAPKIETVLHDVGELIVANIGIPDRFLQADVFLSELQDFAGLLAPRAVDSHKGSYGHVLVVGGAPGKTGAATMSGLSALRAGAGWVTVASSHPVNIEHPELMAAELGPALPPLDRITVIAVGPGIGNDPQMVRLVRETVFASKLPIIIDADGLNAIAGMEQPFEVGCGPRILTPHPGEMSRLMQVTGDRLADAKNLASRWNCCVVLKGHRTVIAHGDEVWVNPTGTPALAKAGSGDILTGVIGGLVAQFPSQWQLAVRCGVYLHGRAGQLAAKDHGEKGVIATDLLRYLYADL
ncbi:bifunctional NAD(P)H-hydrate repair enzyme Nnr [Bryobacterales bacterium F-183]|nr:bifunctional NAD(P)H-hydrate repair enzyme Nnr [Bryobacterales bacterium F-183]